MVKRDSIPDAHCSVVLLNPLGLHLRPAAQFAGLARRFTAEIRVHRDDRSVNGKSVLDLASLAEECGACLNLEARGLDAELAIAALVDLVSGRFHEGGD